MCWQMQETFSRSSVSCLINANLRSDVENSSEEKKGDPCWQVTQQLHHHLEKVFLISYIFWSHLFCFDLWSLIAILYVQIYFVIIKGAVCVYNLVASITSSEAKTHFLMIIHQWNTYLLILYPMLTVDPSSILSLCSFSRHQWPFCIGKSTLHIKFLSKSRVRWSLLNSVDRSDWSTWRPARSPVLLEVPSPQIPFQLLFMRSVCCDLALYK